MSKVDQFESAFRAAAKAVFRLEAPRVEKVLLVTDLEEEAAETFSYENHQFLSVIEAAETAIETGSVTWGTTTGAEYTNVAELLQCVENHKPDLIVTYRHLKSDAWKWPFSLGGYLDVLTQAAGCPVLVVPHPAGGGALAHAGSNTDVVMAITDLLTGDDKLVNWSARFTARGGTLFLTHVENEAVFERYAATIGKIPSIDTSDARQAILDQLLKEPADFIESCTSVLASAGLGIEVRSIVTLGHRLGTYKRLIEDHEVDLLVMNTKDEYQAAMHGLAYPLAVELRSIPLLLL